MAETVIEFGPGIRFGGEPGILIGLVVIEVGFWFVRPSVISQIGG
jgi:hypothetical protein